MPKSAHIHVNRIAASEIPPTAEVAGWILSQFAVKESLLNKFYDEQLELGPKSPPPTSHSTPSLFVAAI